MHHEVNMTEREGNKIKDAQEIGNKIATWLLFIRVMKDWKEDHQGRVQMLRVDVPGRKIRKRLCARSLPSYSFLALKLTSGCV